MFDKRAPTRPTHLLHQAYILWGVETYRDCGGRVKLPWTRSQAVESIDRYWRDGRMWEYPQDAPADKATSIDAPPRLWCIGMALAFYAKWGNADHTAKTFAVIDRDFGPWPDLRFQPKGPRGEGRKTFYPRHAAHALLGLALYAYPTSRTASPCLDAGQSRSDADRLVGLGRLGLCATASGRPSPRRGVCPLW